MEDSIFVGFRWKTRRLQSSIFMMLRGCVRGLGLCMDRVMVHKLDNTIRTKRTSLVLRDKDRLEKENQKNKNSVMFGRRKID